MISKETAKKLAINRIPVPIEVLDNVKDYLFYNETTSPMIQNIKCKKSQICEIIKTAITIENWDIRNNNYFLYRNVEPIHTNMVEEWLFIIDAPVIDNDLDDDYWPLSETYEFGARICKICGDYKSCTYFYYDHYSVGINSKNTCKCTYKNL